MILKKLFYYISLIIKIDCVGCGSLQPNKSGLCEKCLRQLNTYKKINDLNDNCFSLYSWQPHVSDLISSYVYYLKSIFSYQSWSVISEEFLNSVKLEMNVQSTLLVPIPSSTGRNHSLYFAKNLSKLTGMPYKQVLSYVKTDQPTQSQKQKNKQERAEQLFVIDEKFTDIIQSYKGIVFVDDIITTGATYTAAQQAVRLRLSGHSNDLNVQFFLWTGFKREKNETRC